MSLLIFDEQINREAAIEPLRPWAIVLRLKGVRPKQHIHDDRVPDLLRQLNGPTFVTIDRGFWEKYLCDAHYCILYLALRDDQQNRIPSLLRQLFRLPAFKTKAARIGKVAHLSSKHIEYWQCGDDGLHILTWPTRQRR